MYDDNWTVVGITFIYIIDLLYLQTQSHYKRWIEVLRLHLPELQSTFRIR